MQIRKAMTLSKVSTPRKPAKERKAEIVQATIRLAGDVGPDRLTTELLAREVGVSQAAIFRHFATKSDIWEAVGRTICDLMGGAEPEEGEGRSHGERLKSLVLGQLGFISRTPAVPAILFSRELHAENETLRLFFSKLMENRHKKLAGIIQDAKMAGEFSGDVDPRDAAYLVLALIQGLAMRWSLNARGFDLVEEGERLFDLLVAGFRRT